MKSLYEECTRWLFLNLVELCKNTCNETKKIVFLIIPEGMRGKCVGLMGLLPARNTAMVETGLFPRGSCLWAAPAEAVSSTGKHSYSAHDLISLWGLRIYVKS